MHKTLHLVLGLLVVLALASCEQEPSGPAATTPPAAVASAAQTNAKSANVTITNPLFSIDPATMTSCDPATIATVKWDVHRSHPDIQTVAIWAGAGSSSKLFSSGGATGEAKTGLWVQPGSQFQMKDQATGEVLGQITVGGPACP